MNIPLDVLVLDLGALHPALAGADGVEMLAVALVSWVGGHVVTRGELLGWAGGQAPPHFGPAPSTRPGKVVQPVARPPNRSACCRHPLVQIQIPPELFVAGSQRNGPPRLCSFAPESMHTELHLALGESFEVSQHVDVKLEPTPLAFGRKRRKQVAGRGLEWLLERSKLFVLHDQTTPWQLGE